jgi:hypothetical protein
MGIAWNGLSPGRLWSLLDVIEFDAAAFFNLLRFLSKIEHDSILDKTDDERLDQANIAGIRFGLNQLKPMCDAMSLNAASRNVELLLFLLSNKTVGQVRDNISNIRYIIEKDAAERKYFHMTPDEAIWYTNEFPFGESVAQSFKSSKGEAVEAAQCFATDHHTACVFHCMRVLETGLGALAGDVNVNFGVQNWQNIIDQIEKEIRALGKSLPAGVKKTEQLHRLSVAAKEFVYFKDGWRNHAAHNRSRYGRDQAISILNHTKAFMTALSLWLTE